MPDPTTTTTFVTTGPRYFSSITNNHGVSPSVLVLAIVVTLIAGVLLGSFVVSRRPAIR